MNGILSYNEFLKLLPPDAEKKGCTYDELAKALRVSKQTLFNAKYDGDLHATAYIGKNPLFFPVEIYEWYVIFTGKHLRKKAA